MCQKVTASKHFLAAELPLSVLTVQYISLTYKINYHSEVKRGEMLIKYPKKDSYIILRLLLLVQLTSTIVHGNEVVMFLYYIIKKK